MFIRQKRIYVCVCVCKRNTKQSILMVYSKKRTRSPLQKPDKDPIIRKSSPINSALTININGSMHVNTHFLIFR